MDSLQCLYSSLSACFASFNNNNKRITDDFCYSNVDWDKKGKRVIKMEQRYSHRLLSTEASYKILIKFVQLY